MHLQQYLVRDDTSLVVIKVTFLIMSRLPKLELVEVAARLALKFFIAGLRIQTEYLLGFSRDRVPDGEVSEWTLLKAHLAERHIKLVVRVRVVIVLLRPHLQ